jgi:transcriptional regulator with XRE-family HTH domain/DNA-binding phage protein
VRDQSKLTLAEVAAAAGIDTSYLSRLESGAKLKPSPRVTEAICLALGIRSDWLLTGTGEPWIWPSGGLDINAPRPLSTRKERESERSMLVMRWALQEKLSVPELLQALDSVLDNPGEPPSGDLARLILKTARRLVAQLRGRLDEDYLAIEPPEPGLKPMGVASWTAKDGTTVRVPATAVENKSLTDVYASVKQPVMKSEMARLLQRLNAATKRRGSKTELARHMGVKRSCISVWLSGAREPGGAATLKLLHWLQNQQGNESL